MSRWQRLKRTISFQLPFYVTRKNADGVIATYSVNGWVAIAAIMLVSANVLLWGIVGVIVALGVLL
jgi:hypothetical protein